MENYYGVTFDSGDYWSTRLVKIIDAPINIGENNFETVYVTWSEYHREYKVTEEETDIQVIILPCFDEYSRIDNEDDEDLEELE